jgi:hypothetical protein
MSAEQIGHLDARIEQALEELKGLILRRYPDAQFSIVGDPDDPSIVVLDAIVDVEDTDEVLDVVIDRLGELRNDEGLPIFVVPLRPLERAIEIYREQQREREERERARALGAS